MSIGKAMQSYTMIEMDWLILVLFIVLNMFKLTGLIVLNSVIQYPMLYGFKTGLIALVISIELAITGLCFPLIVLNSKDDCVRSGVSYDFDFNSLEYILSWFFSNLWIHIIIVSLLIVFMFFSFTNEKFKARFLHYTIGLDEEDFK